MTASLPLFVYGTLRSGGAEERLLFGAKLLGETSVPGFLYDFGPYPAMVPRSGSPVPGSGSLVYGELWSCTSETLSRLDAYEGVAEELFARIRLDSAAGPCWVYVAGGRLRRDLTRATIVPSGRWRPAERPSP